MLLLIHILFGTLSVLFGFISLLIYSKRIKAVKTILIFFTLGSGVVLALTNPVSIKQICLSGLSYLILILIIPRILTRKFNQYQNN